MSGVSCGSQILVVVVPPDLNDREGRVIRRCAVVPDKKHMDVPLISQGSFSERDEPNHHSTAAVPKGK